MTHRTKTKTITINHKQLEDAVASYLYAISAVDDHLDIMAVDFGLPVDKDGMVTLDLEILDGNQVSFDV